MTFSLEEKEGGERRMTFSLEEKLPQWGTWAHFIFEAVP